MRCIVLTTIYSSTLPKQIFEKNKQLWEVCLMWQWCLNWKMGNAQTVRNIIKTVICLVLAEEDLMLLNRDFYQHIRIKALLLIYHTFYLNCWNVFRASGKFKCISEATNDFGFVSILWCKGPATSPTCFASSKIYIVRWAIMDSTAVVGKSASHAEAAEPEHRANLPRALVGPTTTQCRVLLQLFLYDFITSKYLLHLIPSIICLIYFFSAVVDKCDGVVVWVLP